MPRNDVPCSPKNIFLKWCFQNWVFRRRNESVAATAYYKEATQTVVRKAVSKSCHLAILPAVAHSK